MPETATTQPEFAERLTRYLAQRLDAPTDTLTLTRLSQGWESDILRVDSSLWPTPRVLRLYFGAHAGPTALQEFRVMEMLAQAGYPVPHVELVEADTDALGRPFLLMDYIAGVSMGRRIYEPATREAGYTEFCELLAQLHTLRWSHLSAAQQIPSITVEQQVEHWATYSRSYPMEAFDALSGWLMAHLVDVKPQPLGMVHWDFHWENILVDAGGKAWVIDWTRMSGHRCAFRPGVDAGAGRFHAGLGCGRARPCRLRRGARDQSRRIGARYGFL